MDNLVTITVHTRRFELWPPCPEVRSVAESFIVVVNWNFNTDWDSITVTNFTDQYGAAFPIVGPDPVLTPANPVAQIAFQRPVFGEGFYCKYDLVYQPSGGGAPCIVDPTLKMRPVGG